LPQLNLKSQVKTSSFKRNTCEHGLSPSSTAAALTGEVARLHGALERFGYSLKAAAPAVETADCMNSPMPSAGMMGMMGHEAGRGTS
jgi:hypothetical protein